MRESFAIVQRTLRSADSLTNIQFEPEAVSSSRRKHLSNLIEEASKLQKEMQDSAAVESKKPVTATSVPPSKQTDQIDDAAISAEDARLDGDEDYQKQPVSSSVVSR